MTEGDSYSEKRAAELLPGKPHERTLRRWRKAKAVPFCRTPGGRIFYTFRQLAEIGAMMRVEPVEHACVSAHARLCPHMPGDSEDAAPVKSAHERDHPH